MWAPRLTTSSRAASGCSAPKSRLMLTPLGRTPMARTLAPSSEKTRGATR